MQIKSTVIFPKFFLALEPGSFSFKEIILGSLRTMGKNGAMQIDGGRPSPLVRLTVTGLGICLDSDS